MASNTTKKQAEAKPVEGDKPKRRNLTPAERIAKMEAELAATREKAEAANRKKAEALVEKRNALTAKVAELKAKVDEINLELDSLGHVDQPAEGDVAVEAQSESTEG